jgi:BspA type Leucine rich repeat region (6 copies)
MKTSPLKSPLFFLLATVLLLPIGVEAQFTFTTNNGTITLTGYTGSGGDVVIPSTTNGFPVTTIAPNAFSGKSTVTSYTLPNSITNIGDSAFYANSFTLTKINIPGSVITLGSRVCAACFSLVNINLGDGLTTIGTNMFDGDNFKNIVIPNSVTTIGPEAFRECQDLANIILSASLVSIGSGAFDINYALTSVYFLGNAPNSAPTNLFSYSSAPSNLTVYYLPHTTGWTNTFGGKPAVLWTPPLPPLGITTYSNLPVVIFPYLAQSIGNHYQVQMTTNLNSGNWVTVTNSVLFIGLQITNQASPAFYRLN